MAPAPPVPPAPAPVADPPVPVVEAVPAVEPEPEHQPEPEPVHEPVAFVPPPQPVVADEEPEPVVESEYGWAREDTREFEPISAEPEPGRAGTEHEVVGHEDPVEKPVLERVHGAGSRRLRLGGMSRT